MATLNRFGVDLPNSGRRMMQQPKSQNKFRVLLYGFGYPNGLFDDDSAAIAINTESVTKPKINFNTQEMHAFDGVAHYSGKKRWQDITLEVRDSVDNSALQAMAAHLQTQSDHHRRLAPRDASTDYKFEMWIQTLSGETRVGDYFEMGASLVDRYLLGNEDAPETPRLFAGTLDTWVCQGCTITDYNFGDQLNYNTAQYYTMSLTIKPDNCFLLDDKGKPIIMQPGGGLVNTLQGLGNLGGLGGLF